MRKITQAEINANLEDLCTYQDLRSYLVARIAKLKDAKTSRRMAERVYMTELRDILDLCAVLCNYNDESVEADDLYSFLS